MITNCYALQNVAFFGGVFEIDSINSIVIITNCVFEGNIGFNSKVSAGGGCVMALKGDQTTQLHTSNNLYFNSGIGLRGDIFYTILLHITFEN